MRARLLLPIAVLAASLLSVDQEVHAKKLYRWVDENGRVYFSDQVPPEQVQHKRETLNQNAKVVDVVDQAKTAEELVQQKRLQALRLEQEKIIAKQAANDKVLLATYRTQEDIERAQANKMALLDSEKKAIEGSRQRLQQQLQQQQLNAANLERNAQKVPDKLLADIAASKQQLALNEQELARHMQARQVAEEAFEADIARFRILTRADSAQPNMQAGSEMLPNDNELGLFVCRDAAQCDKAWQAAKVFVDRYATTGRDVDTDKLVMTAAPAGDNDLALSVARMGQGDSQRLFLDLHCKLSTLGQELCSGDVAQSLRKGFAAFIRLQLSSTPEQ